SSSDSSSDTSSYSSSISDCLDPSHVDGIECGIRGDFGGETPGGTAKNTDYPRWAFHEGLPRLHRGTTVLGWRRFLRRRSLQHRVVRL
ncbi:unnamed protein product, partial [Scytosiphon promiscuus]